MPVSSHKRIKLIALAFIVVFGTVASAETGASPPRRVFPLKTGMYVSTGQDCDNSANAGTRWYDGKGIRGSATHACRSKIVGRRGDAFVVDQNCIDTPSGSGPRRVERQVITIQDMQRFSLSAGADSSDYHLCAKP
jgi:hypothetical protein